MRKNMKLTSLVMALLLLAAGCGREENMTGAGTEGGITLTPAVELAGGWSTGADTRADQKVPVILAPGGNIGIMIMSEEEVIANPDVFTTMFMNYFEVTADGKLSRLPFSGAEMETEAPLNIAASGRYLMSSYGEVNLTTDGITYRSYISSGEEIVTIGTNGKFSLPMRLNAGGLRLNVKGMDGAAYTGADVTATLKTVSQYDNKAFETKTLTAAAPSVIWGDISSVSSSSSVTAGTQLLELVVGGKTYKVNAPRQISFTSGRLYTFNVRVGATSITVSSDDLSIGDFEVQASTAGKAEFVPFYNGQHPNLLALDGCTPYWVAPVDAMNYVAWTAIDFNTVCPKGWHVPTKDEFSAMTGIPAVEGTWNTMDYDDPNFGLIGAAFDGGGYDFWASDGSNASDAWILIIYDGVGYHHIVKNTMYGGGQPHSVCCVRKK